MKPVINGAILLGLSILLVASCQQPPPRTGTELALLRKVEQETKEREVMVIDTDYGEIVIVMMKDAAKNHCVKFKDLADTGFFDGLKFHYLKPGKLIQGGDINSRDDDPSDDGTGDPGFTLQAEIKARHVVGSVGLAHPPDEPNTGNSQFYICLSEMPELDGRYTVFGQVVLGLGPLRQISQVPVDENGHLLEPVVMNTVRVERRVVPPILLPDAK